MVEKTNKILIILVSVLIVLLVISVILFSVMIKINDKEQPKLEESSVEEKSEVIEISQIPQQEENEVIVAILDENGTGVDGDVIAIGEDNSQLGNSVENNSAPYYIKVNVQTNTVTIYKKDGKGNYTIPLKAMICSCGGATPVEGTYGLKKYNNWYWKTLYGGGYGRYATQIEGDILFNSVPYNQKGDDTSLKYEEYDKLGSYTTLGSVNLTVIDAKWIFENCPAGTQVTFYTSENPGPLGKPTAKQITEDEQVRGWDPTDPNDNNPWKNYVRPEKKPGLEQKPDENTTQSENTNTTLDTNTVIEENNTTETNTTVDNNNTVENSSNTIDNTVTNNTVEENTINDTNVENTTSRNEVNNNSVVENRVLEQSEDVTITSEVLDTNNV